MSDQTLSVIHFILLKFVCCVTKGAIKGSKLLNTSGFKCQEMEDEILIYHLVFIFVPSVYSNNKKKKPHNNKKKPHLPFLFQYFRKGLCIK